MTDIDPYAQLAATQLTPRSTNIVDQVAETRRVADSIMRANPLYNAVVDGGLTVWRGNYADSPTDPIRNSIVWIGEFPPTDAVKGKLQRGVQITRDDPVHSQAFAMFDPQAETRGAGNPLRQRVFMQDADGRQILSEGQQGGTAFPWTNVPLYPSNPIFTTMTTATGGNTQAAPFLQSWMGLDNINLRTIWEGYAPMTGTRLEYLGYAFTQSASQIGISLRITFDDPANSTYTTPETNVPISSTNLIVYYNLDFTTLIPAVKLVGQTIRVEVLGRLISGQLKFAYHFPTKCRVYSI